MATINFCAPQIYGLKRTISLGVLSLAAVARNCGHRAAVRDVNALCTDVGELPPTESLVDYLLSGHPDIIGFSTVFSSYPTTIRLAIACKRRRPEVYVLMGGAQASATAEETLRAYPEIDGIMAGECEAALETFLREFEHGKNWGKVPNLVWRKDSRLIINQQAPLLEDLDSLPLPAYDLSPFTIADIGQIHIEAGRGCPHRCAFCSTSRFWGRKIRMKSAPKLIEQTKALLARYKTDRVSFVSDNFTASPKFCLEFCAAVKASGVKFKWNASSCVEALSAGMSRKLAESGCENLYLGIETGSAKVAGIIGKELPDRRTVINKVLNANKAGITCTAAFIIGFPEEELSDIRETLKLLFDVMFAGDMRNLVHLHTLAPFSGTPVTRNNIHRLEFYGIFPGQQQFYALRDGEEMIRSHPEIFTALYTIKNDDLSKEFIISLYLLIVHMQNFPDTVRSLWRQEGVRFLDLLLSQAKHLERDNMNWATQNRAAIDAMIYEFLQQRIVPKLGNPKKMREHLKHEYAISRAVAGFGGALRSHKAGRTVK